MIQDPIILRVIGRSSQEQCREIGELFLSLADSPRDVVWKANFQRALEQCKEPPLAERLRKASARVVAVADRLRELGLDHQSLMDAELDRRGDRRRYADVMVDASG